jgi:hypothetical protein
MIALPRVAEMNILGVALEATLLPRYDARVLDARKITKLADALAIPPVIPHL